MSSVQPSSFNKKFTSSLSLTGVRFTGRKLGQGSDAVVLEADHQGTLCAAKMLHPILLDDISSGGAQRLVANFENEIITWYSLRHPHIVLLLGVHFEHGSRVPTLILEKMQSSLRRYIDTSKKEEVPLPDKVFILRQVSEALAYLHSRQPPLVHHDLSPNNILLNQDSLLTKITDFGMSRVVDPSHSTRKSSVKGTLAFMPPEALVDPPKYTEKLDIFSFGNLTLFTVTHLWPEPGPSVVFDGDKVIGILELQRREQYTRSLTAEERSSFFPMIQSCLENRPDRRPTSLQLVQHMRQMEKAHPRPELTQQLKEMGDQLKLKDDQLKLKDSQLKENNGQLKEKDEQMRRKVEESSQFWMEKGENVRQEDSALNAWLKQYEKVIQEQGSVSVQITRCVLIGPARVGKSCLKQLLVHNEPRPVHKSTDVMEAPVVLTSMYHSEKSVWKVLTVDNLLQGLNKCTAEGEYNSESPPHQPSTPTIHNSPPHQPSTPTIHNSPPHQPSTPTIQEPHLDSGSIQSSGTVHPSELPSTVPEKDDCPNDLKSRLSRFVEHLQSVGYTDLKMNGLKLIHLFDCGGQLAFQDAIPCLIHAPSAFIVVFNASVHLEEEKEWTYCPHEGSEELGRGHKEPQWNILLRIFSSIHSLQYKCHADLKKLTQHKSSNQDEPSNSWPIAVVGTHKAILNQHEDYVNINKSIISRFADLTSKPYWDLFIREPPDLVENTTIDDAHRINELRELISRYASFSLNLPLTWLILELFTRSQHPELLFISYEDLKVLCVNGKLITNGDEEFNSLLRVLHALGFYAFFPLEDLGVPLEQNWVCTDAATLYKEVSKLLMVQYTLDNPKSKTAEYLKSEGMIVLNKDSDLRKLFNELKIGKINGDSEIDRVTVFSPKWLLLVLVYIGLAAKFKRGGIEQVFIPLALPFNGCDLPPVTELSIATLCLTLEFPSGPSTGSVTPILTDMPCGIFPCLVVLLLSDREESKCPFEVFAEESDRACIKLKPPDHKGDYRLYLKNHINYVEVALQVNETVINEDHEAAEKVYKICEFLCQTLTSTLEDAFFKLFGEQPREKAVTARCGFKCTSCPASENDHLTVMGDLEPQSFSCVFKQGKCPLQSRNCSQRIWFCSVPAAKFSVKTGTRCRIWVMDDPSSSAQERSPANTSSSVGSKRQPSDSVPTVTMAGMEGKIDSSLDIFGVEEYHKGLIGDMAILGAVLGIRADTQAIINRNGKPNSQLLEILDVYIAKESPTWGDFCTALKKYHGFNKVRVKIQRDHNYKALECT